MTLAKFIVMLHVLEWMKNIKPSFFFGIILLLAACSPLETVENYDEENILVERYTIDKETLMKEGNYERFYPNGSLEEKAVYHKDTLQGERQIFHPNGQLAILEHYRDGEFVGAFASYYEDGQVEVTGQYLENAMNGTWKSYYPSGKLKAVTTFENNEENGPFEEYYENGNPQAKGTYRNGENEEGLLELYAENGTLEKKMECQKGICRTTWTAKEGEVAVTSDSLFQQIKEFSTKKNE